MTGCGREIAGFPCCEIILGDCNDYLWMIPPNAIDLVLTDSPYGMKFQSGARKEKHQRIHGDDAFPFATVAELIELPRLAAYFWCRWDNLWGHSTLPKPRSVITWVKPGTGMGDLAHEHGRASETCLFYPGPEHKFKKRPSDVIRADREENDLHPTVKPLALVKEQLDWYDFETVLDPFSGSGTVALAAKQMGKHFLAFEIDKVFHGRSVARLENLKIMKNLSVEGGLFA